MRVGDIVTLDPDSRWAGPGFAGYTNPVGVCGQIIDIDDDDDSLPISVKWDNGQENSYDYTDLLLVGV